MEKEILFYSPIYSFTAEDYISQLEANKRYDIKVRMCCPGGDVYASYGMIAKFQEHKSGKSIHVDGFAYSGGCFMCFYAKDVTCLDVTDFMAHRAALPSYIENDKEKFTDELRAMLTKINASLRAGMESKVSAEKFAEVTGVSLDDMFSLDSRIDVKFTAAQAEAMGLVSKVIPLTASAKNEITALSASYGVAAFSSDPVLTEIKNKAMSEIKTLADLKAAHPALYTEAKNEGIEQGITQERDRVTAALVYVDVDAAGVKKVIADGKPLTQTFFAEMNQAQVKASLLTGLEKGNTNTTTAPVSGAAPTGEEAEADAFLAAAQTRILKQHGIVK